MGSSVLKSTRGGGADGNYLEDAGDADKRGLGNFGDDSDSGSSSDAKGQS